MESSAVNDPTRRELLAGAERLHERLARGARSSCGRSLSEQEIAEALGPWARAFAAGDFEALARRLAWDGMTPVEAAAALARPLAPPASAPWLERLLALGVLGQDCRELATAAPLGAAAKTPFAELWWPWVEAAATALWRDAPAASEFTAEIRAELRRELLRDVADLSGLAALEAFSAGNTGTPAAGTPASGWYRAFVSGQLTEGLLSFYRTYPALLRRTGVLLETWRTGTQELAERLRADRGRLAEAFGLRAEPGRLVELRRLAADRHQGGRGVYWMSFEDGWQVIYKPRALDLEAGFARLASGAAARGLASAPPAARVLAREGYGWMEAIRRESLERTDPELVDRYFRRAGALMAFAYAWNASDLHAENVIASAAGPVVVDWEMLQQPETASGAISAPAVDSVRDEAANGSALGSCLDSGLLGSAGTEASDAIYPGLEPVAPRRLTDRARRWRNLGSDAIAVAAGELFAAPRENALIVAGGEQDPAAHAPALLAGFAEAYRFLVAHRGELLAGVAGAGGLPPCAEWPSLEPSRPPAPAGAARTRVLVRRSQEYATILGMLGLPRFQRSGVASGYLLEASLRSRAGSRERPRSWPLVASERAAIEDLDLPRFEIGIGSVALAVPGGGETVEGLFTRSGAAVVVARLAALGEEDLADQLALLRDALDRGPAAALRGPLSSAEEAGSGRESRMGLAAATANRIRDDAALALADALLDEIEQGEGTLAQRAEAANHAGGAGGDQFREGSVASDGEREVARLADLALYDGAAGRALWLAARASIGGGERFDSALARVLETIAVALDRWEPAGARVHAPAPAGPIGLLSGIGSLAWSLVWIERLRPAVRSAASGRSPLDLARRAAALLTPGRLAADRRLDLEGGLAGALLALLAVFEATGESQWLELAVGAGGELVSRQEPAPGGGAAWRGWRAPAHGVTSGEQALAPMLAGYAHGAAGIGRALAALSSFSGEPKFLRAVEAAQRFERGLYDQERGNWPVVSAGGRTSERTWMRAWCHGAPGIALGRAMLPPVLRDGRVLEEIEQALATTLAAGLGTDDHLCCGAAGRIGVLDAVGRRLSRSEWVVAAADLGAELLARGQRRGFRLPRARRPARARRGLFRGLPGISLQLLVLSGELPPLLALPLPSEVLLPSSATTHHEHWGTA